MRSFIAVSIRPSSDMQIVFDSFSRLKNIRITRSENIHITLKFLGDITGERATELCRMIGSIRHEKFYIETGEIGAFPDIRRPRVIIIGISGHGLNEIYSEIVKITGSDGDFLPHITVGRVKGPFTIPGIKIKPEKYLIEKVCLYKSELKSTGPEYTEICCSQLI